MNPEGGVEQRGALHRILGLGFGLAMITGGTVGVGILRTPGLVAAQLGDRRLILGAWLLGGLYVLLGSVAVSELGAMLPRAGGFYVFARRAFGDSAGLVVGLSDWLGLCTAIAYVAVTAGDFAAALVPALAGWSNALACGVILLFGVLHWRGVRVGSRTQEWSTIVKGVLFAALAVACLRAVAGSGGGAGILRPPQHFPLALLVALQSIVITYDGWYAAIYFTEENVDPGRTIPRSMIGGTALVIIVYLVINAAFLHVLPVSRLANSTLPAADAVQSLAGAHAGTVVTAIALVSVLVIVNALLMCAPRVLFGLSRDGMLFPAAARVNARGTPVLMWACVAVAVAFAATGVFQRLIAIAGFIFVMNHCTAFASLLVLRRREPRLERPFRAWLYPWSTCLVLAGGVAFLVAALVGDPRNSLPALALVLAGYPLAWWRTRRIQSPARPGAISVRTSGHS